MSEPSYLTLSSEERKEKIIKANDILTSCILCPRACKTDRTSGNTGFCRMGDQVKVNSFFTHHGEEPSLSGNHGSGTIFFSGCTMQCLFCQNYQISQLDNGEFYTNEELADIFLKLQHDNCHNLNLVTPTQWVPQILTALEIAIEKGFSIPLVYNTNSYDSMETLKLLDGIIDIYLPDIKYADNDVARQLSNVPNYVEASRQAIKEMFDQVGYLQVNGNGIAQKGIIIRHLILPDNLSGTNENLQFLYKNFGEDIYISLMAQYTPLYRAEEVEKINRRITREEYHNAISLLDEFGFTNGWYQKLDDLDDEYIFDFGNLKSSI